VHLSGKEYSLLELLSQHKGTVVTKEMLLAHLYSGTKKPELKIIDVFVCHLRKKNSPRRRAEIITSRRYGVAAMSFKTRSSPVGRPQPGDRSLLRAVDEAAADNAALIMRASMQNEIYCRLIATILVCSSPARHINS
jgi:hypothetical protein